MWQAYHIMYWSLYCVWQVIGCYPIKSFIVLVWFTYLWWMMNGRVFTRCMASSHESHSGTKWCFILSPGSHFFMWEITSLLSTNIVTDGIIWVRYQRLVKICNMINTAIVPLCLTRMDGRRWEVLCTYPYLVEDMGWDSTPSIRLKWFSSVIRPSFGLRSRPTFFWDRTERNRRAYDHPREHPRSACWL